MKAKEPCGCTHDGARWLSECSEHKAENDALHAQAMADHCGGRWLSGPTRTWSGGPANTQNLPRESASPTPDWLDLPESPT